MSGSVERGGRTDLRQRRAFQKLAADALGVLGLLAGPGIILDPDAGTISVFLAPVNSYLSTTGGLHVDTAAIISLPNLATIGTITTGVWNGTVITGQYGGTGVANTGKTITLGGNLTTVGAFATTITVTNTTNSTLPAGTHTLAGLDVAQSWTAAQTFTTGTLKIGGSGAGVGTFIFTGATNRNITFPSTGAYTVAGLSLAQTFSNTITFSGNVIWTGGGSFNNGDYSVGEGILWEFLTQPSLQFGAIADLAFGDGTAEGYTINRSGSQTGNLIAVYNGDYSTPVWTVDASGNLRLEMAGQGVYIKEGTNATSGVAILVGGTVVVSTTKVTANSRIHLTAQNVSGVGGVVAVGVSARIAGTSFTITSANILDTSSIAWMIIEPA